MEVLGFDKNFLIYFLMEIKKMNALAALLFIEINKH